MTPDEFCRQHPYLYQMAHPAAFESIQRHGLLSTERIVALLNLPQHERELYCAHHRPAIVPLTHPEFGDFRLRDQKPLNPKALARSLPPDLTVHDWYRTLNARTFLWIHRRSLDKLLAARAYRSTPHLILTIDSRALLARHLDRITVTTSNTGAAFPLGTAPRSLASFIPLNAYPAPGKRKPLVELTVLGGIPDIRDFIVQTERTEPLPY